LEQVVVSRTGAEPEGTVPRGAVLQRIPVAGEAVAQARGIDGRPIAVPELRGGRDLLHGHHRWRSAGRLHQEVGLYLVDLASPGKVRIREVRGAGREEQDLLLAGRAWGRVGHGRETEERMLARSVPVGHTEDLRLRRVPEEVDLVEAGIVDLLHAGVDTGPQDVGRGLPRHAGAVLVRQRARSLGNDARGYGANTQLPALGRGLRGVARHVDLADEDVRHPGGIGEAVDARCGGFERDNAGGAIDRGPHAVAVDTEGDLADLVGQQVDHEDLAPGRRRLTEADGVRGQADERAQGVERYPHVVDVGPERRGVHAGVRGSAGGRVGDLAQERRAWRRTGRALAGRGRIGAAGVLRRALGAVV